MEYTVQKLAKLAGVSARTLRYYDQIGLLRPSHIRENGYRVYGAKQIDALQQILFYRELGVPLEDIAAIIYAPDFDEKSALLKHRDELISRRNQLDLLIINVEKSIDHTERRIIMSDNEKFEGFKDMLITDNEAKYGEEIREKYGDEQVKASNSKFKKMTQEQFDEMQRIGEEILTKLDEVFSEGNPQSEKAQKLAELHKKWLGFTWEKYSPEAHAGLAKMYVDDERFAAYYDRGNKGKAEFLRDAILTYTGQK